MNPHHFSRLCFVLPWGRFPLVAILLACILTISSCKRIQSPATSPPPSSSPSAQQIGSLSKAELAQAILTDQALDQVLSKSKALLQTSGLNAGGHYNEVWIRDFNTFIELALEAGDKRAIREALLTFFYFQGKDGNIIDGYVPAEKAAEGYKYIKTRALPSLIGFKNTVESDQESSLVQSLAKYVRLTNDQTILTEVIEGEKVHARLGRALDFLLKHRFSREHGLIWGATTADWGDVQPEHEWGVEIDQKTHRAIDIYDNAMFILAANQLAELPELSSREKARWKRLAAKTRLNVRKYLWDAEKNKFIPHLYLNGSPFPASLNEQEIYFHGGTAVAIEAGVLTKDEAILAYNAIRHNVATSGAHSIGLTVFPPYPAGTFKNPQMAPYSYQNGGDWTWFGARWVPLLLWMDRPDQAYVELLPMVNRVIEHNDFFEWYDKNNQPRGAKNFKGAAGQLRQAILALKQWAYSSQQPPSNRFPPQNTDR